MIDASHTDPLEYWGPVLKDLTRDLGQWVFADCEAEELVIVYDRLSPFGTGLARRVGIHSFDELRRLQQERGREGSG
jgi:hypothetical protein